MWNGWAKQATQLVYRPNVFWYSGGASGLPAVALRNTLEDFRFLAEHHCMGLIFDGTPEHWATQGPQYYAMAQLAWDPLQDGPAMLDDYFRRGFGAAAATIRQYFDLLEEVHRRVIESRHGKLPGRAVGVLEEKRPRRPRHGAGGEKEGTLIPTRLRRARLTFR